ncbi:hypothetical protein AB674_16225 [Flavobacterium sp. ABG]|nr:hypothetical protein AB674_16225 [Flavobacterium sp. ABG]
MRSENKITLYSIIAGVFVCSLFPFLIFSKSLFVDLCTQICNFGLFWTPIFWGILLPLFIVFLFWNTAKKISFSLDQISYLKACSQFSFAVSSKLIVSLFTIYTIGMFVNGISFALRSQIPYQILFTILMILFLSFTLMLLTFLSSLVFIKLSQNPQNLN